MGKPVWIFSDCLKYNTVLRSRLSHVTQHSLPQKKAEKGDGQYIQILLKWQKNQTPVVYHDRTAMTFSDGCAIVVHIGHTIKAIFADEAENFIKMRLSQLYSFLRLHILRCTVCVIHLIGKVSWIYHTDQSEWFLSDVLAFRKNSAEKCLAFSSHETYHQKKTRLLETITVLLPE